MSPRKKIGHRAGKSDHKTYCCVVYTVCDERYNKKTFVWFFFVLKDLLPDFTQYTVVTYHSYSNTQYYLYGGIAWNRNQYVHWIWSDLIFFFSLWISSFFLLNALRSDILSQNLSFIVFWRFYCNFFWVISWGIDFAHMGVW